MILKKYQEMILPVAGRKGFVSLIVHQFEGYMQRPCFPLKPYVGAAKSVSKTWWH